MRRLLAISVLAAAAFAGTASPASASHECAYAGYGGNGVSVCAGPHCSDECLIYVEYGCSLAIIQAECA